MEWWRAAAVSILLISLVMITRTQDRGCYPDRELGGASQLKIWKHTNIINIPSGPHTHRPYHPDTTAHWAGTPAEVAQHE